MEFADVMFFAEAMLLLVPFWRFLCDEISLFCTVGFVSFE